MKKEANKKFLAAIGLVLLVVIIVSVFYLFGMSKNTVDLAFSFVAGISMIVLPCTFPLVLVIVPLAMGKGYKKGLGMALLFSLGLIIILSIYGIFVAGIGNIIGLDEAIEKASFFSKILFMVGGTAAILFGLSELGLLKFELPHYMGMPRFIEKRKDYSKAFFLGLFLGNAGVACPNPLFYVLLGDIAVKGSTLFGWWMGFVHGLGRATPLIFLAILAILGVNATTSVMKHQGKIKKGVGWVLVFFGAIIFIMGGAHGWYEENLVHEGWNNFVGAVGLPSELIGEAHEHEEKDIIPGSVALWLLIALIVIPIIWYFIKKQKEVKNGKSPDSNHAGMHGMRKS